MDDNTTDNVTPEEELDQSDASNDSTDAPANDAAPAASTTGTRLFIGSLSWDTTDDGLREHFAQFGTVVDATVIRDRATNRSKGFGFVEMSTPEEAATAIDKADGQELDGRPIVVNEARPKSPQDNS